MVLVFAWAMQIANRAKLREKLIKLYIISSKKHNSELSAESVSQNSPFTLSKCYTPKHSKCWTSVLPNWPTVTILTATISDLLGPPLFTACTDTLYTVNSCRLLRVTDESPGVVVTRFVSTLTPSAVTVYVRGLWSAFGAGSHFTSRETPLRITRLRLEGAARRKT